MNSLEGPVGMRKKSLLFILLGILTVGVAVFFLVQVVQSDSPTKFLEQAKKAFESDNYEESIDLFTKILEEDPSHTEARVGLANAYMALSKYDKAIKVLNDGIELKPKEPQFYYYLSVVHEGMNDLPQVIQSLENGIKATDNTSLKKLMEQLESNIHIKGRKYVQQNYDRDLLLEWEKNDGSIIPVHAEWKLENKDFGSLHKGTDTKIIFHAEKLGTVIVSATIGSITKEAKIHIEEQVVEDMMFDPEEMQALSIGQEVKLSVTGVDAGGNVMDILPEWNSSEENIVKLSTSEGIENSGKTITEGVSTISVMYQDLEKTMDVIVEGNNKFIQTEVQGEGTVSSTPNNMSYPRGTEVTLEATPSAGYEFVGWEGDVTETANPLNLTIESSISVVAVFEPIEHTLNLSISGEGNIIRDTLDSQFKDEESITLFAQPYSGWEFSHWEGSVNESTARIEVLMDQNKDIRAVFEKIGSSDNDISSSDDNSSNNSTVDDASSTNSAPKSESNNFSSTQNRSNSIHHEEKDTSSKSVDTPTEKDKTKEGPQQETKPEKKTDPKPEGNEQGNKQTPPKTDDNSEEPKDGKEPIIEPEEAQPDKSEG